MTSKHSSSIHALAITQRRLKRLPCTVRSNANDLQAQFKHSRTGDNPEAIKAPSIFREE